MPLPLSGEYGGRYREVYDVQNYWSQSFDTQFYGSCVNEINTCSTGVLETTDKLDNLVQCELLKSELTSPASFKIDEIV